MRSVWHALYVGVIHSRGLQETDHNHSSLARKKTLETCGRPGILREFMENQCTYIYIYICSTLFLVWQICAQIYQKWAERMIPNLGFVWWLPELRVVSILRFASAEGHQRSTYKISKYIQNDSSIRLPVSGGLTNWQETCSKSSSANRVKSHSIPGWLKVPITFENPAYWPRKRLSETETVGSGRYWPHYPPSPKVISNFNQTKNHLLMP